MKMQVRAGFVGFGEVNTPKEFIFERCKNAAKELEKRGVTLVTTAPVCDDPEGLQARRAVKELREGGDFDALVICVAGWIPSWAVFQVAEQFKDLPILLWGLSGWQDGDRFVTTADQAGTTALRAPFESMGYTFKYLVNFKGAAPRYDEATEFLKAASAAKFMRTAFIGMSGYRDMRLYGTLYNGCLLKGKIGAEIEHFDLIEIQEAAKGFSKDEIDNEIVRMRREWKFLREPKPGTLENSVRLALAFRQKIEARKYDAFSFCDVDGIKKYLKFAPAGAMTLLHELTEIPSVPENDSYGAVTELIVQALTSQTPGYLEFYEFTEDSALMGTPDYIPRSMTDGPVTVMPNAFGSFGEGLLNVSKVKTGAVTISRLTEKNGQLLIHAAQGTAKTPFAWEEAGWAPPAPQLPSLEIVFDFKAERFLENVAGQHYIVSYGNHMSLLENYCRLAKIGFLATA